MLQQAKAVTKIQACWRRHHQSVEYNACIQSIVIVQSAYRRLLALKQLRYLQEEKERFCATIIQLHVKSFITRLKERRAVVIIQKHWRGWRDSANLKMTISAAIKIQTAVRRYNARTKILMLIHVQNTEKERQMRLEEVAVLKLQSFCRSMKAIRVVS